MRKVSVVGHHGWCRLKKRNCLRVLVQIEVHPTAETFKGGDALIFCSMQTNFFLNASKLMKLQCAKAQLLHHLTKFVS